MRKPMLEEFMEEAEILWAIQQDEKKHKGTFRDKIRFVLNTKAGADWNRLQFVLDDGYKAQISAVKTQEDYDELFKNLYDVACLAFVISNDMCYYCEILDYHLEKIRVSDYICPCCGRKVTLEDTDKLHIDYDDHKLLECFYREFCDNRHKDLERLRKRGTEKHFDLLNWQKGLKQTFGALARVEEIEGEPSEVRQVTEKQRLKAEKERKRTQVEMAREWIRKKRAEGMKFAGEE